MNSSSVIQYLLIPLTISILSCDLAKEPTKPPEEPEDVNRAPSIQSVSITPSVLGPGQQASVSCVATDPDGDNLTYTWSANGGTFPSGAGGSSVTWQAPISAGTYTITCTVNDSKATDTQSAQVSVVVPPSAPSNLTVTVISANEIRLNWDDNSNNEDGFKLERKVESTSFTLLATTLANAITYTDTQVDAFSNTYTYQVKAINAGGESAVAPETKIIIRPSMDTYISYDNPNTVYGSYNYFLVGRPGTGGKIGLIAFDITQVKGKSFSSAIMYLQRDLTYSADPIYITPLVDYSASIVSNWDENSTWNTASLWDEGSIGQMNISQNPAQGTITSTVQAWASGSKPNRGIQLLTNINDQNNWKFYSRESDSSPSLEIIL